MEYSRNNERKMPIEDYEILGRREVFDFENDGRIIIPGYDNRIMGGRVLIPIKND